MSLIVCSYKVQVQCEHAIQFRSERITPYNSSCGFSPGVLPLRFTDTHCFTTNSYRRKMLIGLKFHDDID